MKKRTKIIFARDLFHVENLIIIKKYDNKCCILKLYLEENEHLIIWKKIKYIIEEEKNDYKYLQSLFPKINKHTITKIKCKNFDYIKHFEAGMKIYVTKLIILHQKNNVMKYYY